MKELNDLFFSLPRLLVFGLSAAAGIVVARIVGDMPRNNLDKVGVIAVLSGAFGAAGLLLIAPDADKQERCTASLYGARIGFCFALGVFKGEKYNDRARQRRNNRDHRLNPNNRF